MPRACSARRGRPRTIAGPTLYASAHWRRLLECAVRALDDPLLGLHVGQRITPAHLGALGYALHACRDAGAALSRAGSNTNT